MIRKRVFIYGKMSISLFKSWFLFFVLWNLKFISLACWHLKISKSWSNFGPRRKSIAKLCNCLQVSWEWPKLAWNQQNLFGSFHYFIGQVGSSSHGIGHGRHFWSLVKDNKLWTFMLFIWENWGLGVLFRGGTCSATLLGVMAQILWMVS